MGAFTSPPVPEAVYRIRSASRDPPLYLEWQTDNTVKPVPLKTDNAAQNWKISPLLQTGNYVITSVPSNANLSTQAYTEDGETKYRLFSGGSQAWNLDGRVDQFVIGVAENDTCIDLADNDVPIIWARYNGKNQRFVLEPVLPGDISSGIYSIVNRETNGTLTIWTNFDQLTAPVRVYAYYSVPSTNAERTFTVTPKNGGHALTNTKTPGSTPRWLAQSNGPVVRLLENICRITPVAGTNFYYIATDTSQTSPVLMDTNKKGTNDGWVSAATMDLADTRQHWQFILTK
jgi:hypothetical protein